MPRGSDQAKVGGGGVTSGLGRSRRTRKGENGCMHCDRYQLNHFKHNFNYVGLVAGKKKSPFPEGGAEFSD